MGNYGDVVEDWHFDKVSEFEFSRLSLLHED